MKFATAWLESDFEAARQFQCPGVPALDPEIDKVDLENARIEGAPTPGPFGGGLLEIEDPQHDFHVPFTASEGGEMRRGAVEVALGESDGRPCVSLYGLNVNLPVED